MTRLMWDLLDFLMTMSNMTNQLSSQALFWYGLIGKQGIYDETRSYIPASHTQDVIQEKIGWFDQDLVMREVYGQYALKLWENIDRKTTSPYDMLDGYMEPWVIYGLPRRPAFVLFAVYQRNKQLHMEDYYAYVEEYRSLKWFYTRYMKSQLQIYKLTGSFRRLLGIKKRDFLTVKFKDLPTHVEDVLQAYATPSGIFYQVATFCENRTLQQGIALVRALENYSSKLSKVRSTEEIIRATIEFVNTRLYLEDLVITINPPQLVNLEFIQAEDHIENITRHIRPENYKEIMEQKIAVELAEKAEIQRKKVRKVLSNEDIKRNRKIRRVERKIAAMSFGNDPYNKKRRHYRAKKMVKLWKQYHKVVLRRPWFNNLRVLEYIICEDGDYFVVTSRVTTIFLEESYQRRIWASNPKYFRWFPTYEKAMMWLNKKIEQKKARFTLISREELNEVA